MPVVLAGAILVATAPTEATLPLNVYYAEDFNYTPGIFLNDTVPWDGTATSELQIASDGAWLKFTGGIGGPVNPYAQHLISYTGSAGVIFIHVLVKPGTGNATMWGLWFNDPSGENLARWYGNANSCRGRIGGSSVVTVSHALTSGQWNDLDVRINTTTNTSEFYHNGSYMGTLDHTSTPSNTLGRVRFERVDYSLAQGHFLFFDELRVGEDPQVAVPPPSAPTVTTPALGAVVQTETAIIQWSGEPSDKYEVHVNTTNNSADADGWDSGEQTSSASSCTTGTLHNRTRYYVFTRLHNPGGWGPWSAAGHYFDVILPIRIIPLPQEITWYAGSGFEVNDQTQIVMPVNPDAKDNLTATQLQRKVWDMTGHLPPIVQGGPGAPTSNVIAIGQSSRNTAVAAILASSWPQAAGKTPKTDGYVLGVNNSAVVIAGFDQRGTFYGCQTYIQVLEQFGALPVQDFFCYDYPDRPWRGMMISIRYKFDMDWAKEIMSELFARFKLNIVQLDVSASTIWESHPELYLGDPAEASHMWEVQEVADFAKLHFLEIMGGGPSWTGADSFPTAGTLNPLMREDRSQPDPSPYREEMCGRNPQAQQLMHDLWTEMIDRFQPTRIQTGWDELSIIGHSSCPYCAGTAPTTLFNEFLWNDYNWLHARGITPVMWADMLTTEMNGGPPWNLYQVAATMPKGTVMQDWEYLEASKYTRLQFWIDNDLPSVGSPFGVYDPGIANIWWWGYSVQESQYNTLGLVAFNKFRIRGGKSVLLVPPPGDHQMQNLACYPFVAEWSWTPEVPYYDPPPYDGKVVVRTTISPDRVTGFTAAQVGQDVSLSWVNPTDPTFDATWICYRSDRAPTSPIDGTFLADVPGAPSSVGSTTHAAAPLCPTLYYAAFTHDDVRHFYAPATASVTVTPMPDSDGDGVGDACDQCPNTIPGMAGRVDDQGCPPLIPVDFNRDGDVDGDDLDVFTGCTTGPGIPDPGEPDCTSAQFDAADHDADDDVDQSDFGIFQRCLSGTDSPADPACAS